MSHTIQDLRSLTDDDLIRLHDRLAKNTVVGIAYYLDELERRTFERQGARMIALTQQIEALTRTIRLLTFGNVVLVAASLAVTVRAVGLV